VSEFVLFIFIIYLFIDENRVSEPTVKCVEYVRNKPTCCPCLCIVYCCDS